MRIKVCELGFRAREGSTLGEQEEAADVTDETWGFSTRSVYGRRHGAYWTDLSLAQKDLGQCCG